jgi:hypothetical protein
VDLTDRSVWLNPFHAERETIETHLSPDECIERLRQVMVSRYSPRTWLFAQDDGPVIGGVSGRNFWMQRVHTFVRPWLLQQASGIVEPSSSGSLVHVRVGMKPVNATLHVLLGAALLLVAFVAAVAFPNALAPWPTVAWALWPALALAAYAIDRLWWAGDAAYLRRLVAEIISPGPAWHPYEDVQRDPRSG